MTDINKKEESSDNAMREQLWNEERDDFIYNATLAGFTEDQALFLLMVIKYRNTI